MGALLRKILVWPSPSPFQRWSAASVEGVYKWRWIPVGTLDLISSHPASLADVSSWFLRCRSSNSLPRFLRSTVPSMDRGRGDGRARSKRSFDEFDSDAGRRLEQQLRGRLELAEERRQRKREVDRDWDRSRNRSPEWRRSEERRREEERCFAMGPSRPSEQQKRKKVGDEVQPRQCPRLRAFET
jgi:hypothetical protein